MNKMTVTRQLRVLFLTGFAFYFRLPLPRTTAMASSIFMTDLFIRLRAGIISWRRWP